MGCSHPVPLCLSCGAPLREGVLRCRACGADARGPAQRGEVALSIPQPAEALYGRLVALRRELAAEAPAYLAWRDGGRLGPSPGLSAALRPRVARILWDARAAARSLSPD